MVPYNENSIGKRRWMSLSITDSDLQNHISIGICNNNSVIYVILFVNGLFERLILLRLVN